MNRSGSFKRVILCVMVIAVLAAGCDGLNPPLPTPAAPAAIPSATITPPATPAPPTEPPTSVPTATPSPQWTPEFTVTPGPSPTSDPIDLVMIGQDYRFQALQLSPDGAKRAEVVVYDCIAAGDNPEERQSFEFLRVIHLDDGAEVQLDSQFLSCGGLGAGGLDLLGWSADSRYLLYTPHREGQPDGGCRPWARSVVLVDTEQWTFNQLDQAAASPDGSRLAGWQGQELVVISTESGEMGRVAAAGSPPYVGPPVWSPDGSALAYLQFSSFCGEATGDSAVALVDPATFESRILATQAAPEFATVEWLDGGRLLLTGLLNSGRWVYDLATGQLNPQ
jgi:hypothetical protein